jgi:surface carbohydrate biosynthesis protein
VSGRPWLIIPVETKVRELDAKTYFACAAAERGFQVILGEQNSLLRRLATLPRGIYLDKSTDRMRPAMFDRLERLGYVIAAWCEEGLVYRNTDAYLDERIASAAFEKAAMFFAWGKVHAADIAKKMPHMSARVFATGNPRFDLLRRELRDYYRPEADQYRRAHGRYILVNTNFARFNHFYGPEKLLKILEDRGIIDNEEKRRFYVGWVDFIGSVFASFKTMLPILSRAFPATTIILRPHPSENHDAWREIASDLPNVHVVYEGNVIPWVMSADAIVHNSCTTGVEAALLGRPSFAYRAVQSTTYDSFFANSVSANVEHPDALIGAVRDALQSSSSPAPLSESVIATLSRYVASLDGDTATSQIVEHLWRLSEIHRERTLKTAAARVVDFAKSSALNITRSLLSSGSRTRHYESQKFSGLEQQELDSILDRIRQVTGRFKNIAIRPVSKHVFLVESRAG